MANEGADGGGVILLVILIVAVIMAFAMSGAGGRQADKAAPPATVEKAPAAPPSLRTIREEKAKTGKGMDPFEAETDRLQAALGEMVDGK